MLVRTVCQREREREDGWIRDRGTEQNMMKNPDSWSRQPRPLENGNWVCDDPHCTNVNYPRRTECFKCKKPRGPMGDSVVRDFMEKTKLMKGAAAMSVLQRHQSRAANLPPPQGNLVSAGPAAVAAMDKLNNPWMGHLAAGMERFAFESPRLHGEHHYFSHRSTTTTSSSSSSVAAPEGRRLAEHLVTCFAAASADPIADAGECLTSALQWLHSMALRLQQNPQQQRRAAKEQEEEEEEEEEEEQALSRSFASPTTTTFASLALHSHSLNTQLQAQAAQAQQDHYSPAAAAAVLPAGALLMGLGFPDFLQRPASFNTIASRNMLATTTTTTTTTQKTVKWEDYKDRPSDFLKEFGDPAAMTAAAFGGGLKPEPGVNGNWECEACRNVNFPRRTCCFQCRKKRGAKGDELVQKYVHGLLNDGDRIWAK